MNKRKAADMESTSPLVPGNSQQRRKAIGLLSSPGLSSAPKPTSTDTRGRMRKRVRLMNYYLEMADLNASFAEFAEIQPEYKNFVYEEEQYIANAAEIKKCFFYPLGSDVLTFGTNEFGQIAQSDNIMERKRPAKVNTFSNLRVIKVACGGLHTISVTEDGMVHSWGCNDEGSLGCFGANTAYAPVRVSGFVPSAKETAVGLERPSYTWSDLKGTRGGGDFTDPTILLDSTYEEMIVSIAAGDCHCLALSNTGRVYFFGAYKCKDGKRWRDGLPLDDPRIHPQEKERKPTPPVKNRDWIVAGKCDWPIHCSQLGAEAIEIACGFSYSAALVKRVVRGVQRQDVLTWGMGECGELGRNVFTPFKKSDEEIDEIPKEVIKADSYIVFHVDKVTEDYMTPKAAEFADGATNRIVERIAGGGYRKYP
jgi:regulator of chromosome condensation